MQFLVISDSHKRSEIIEKILIAHTDIRDIFFLGDNASDIEDLQFEYDDRSFHILSGNCDYFSNWPSTAITTLSGVKIYYTHGHTLGVKYSLQRLINSARENGCQIALFGHTHIPQIVYDCNIWVVNPGSCSLSRSGKETYAIIEIENGKVKPRLMAVDEI